MSMNEYGYELSIFEKVIEPRFLCGECKLVLRKPLQNQCGHRFCTPCVEKIKRDAAEQKKSAVCKVCKEEEEESAEEINEINDNAMQRELHTLVVRCMFPNCEEKMMLKDLENHCEHCSYKPLPCSNAGCPEQISKADMPYHVKNVCKFRTMSCPKCGKNVLADNIQTHLVDECESLLEQCHYCGVRYRLHERKRHADECAVPWSKEECPYDCSDYKVVKDPTQLEEHRSSCVLNHVDRVLASIKNVERKFETLSDSVKGMEDQHQQWRALFDGDASDIVSGQERAVATPSTTSISSGYIEDLLRPIKGQLNALEISLGTLVTASSGQSTSSGSGGGGVDLTPALEFATMRGKIETFERLAQILAQQMTVCYKNFSEYETKLVTLVAELKEISERSKDYEQRLLLKDVKIRELEARLDSLEHATNDGTLIWRIADVTRRRKDAIEGKVASIYSPTFYTSRYGYRMCTRLYLNGDGMGKGTHLSLFFVIVRGKYDAILPWPFKQKVTMMLLDQNFDKPVIDAFRPDHTSSSFKRPTSLMNIASGCPLFMPLTDFNEGGYVKDDQIFIKIIVDCSDLNAP